MQSSNFASNTTIVHHIPFQGNCLPLEPQPHHLRSWENNMSNIESTTPISNL